MSIFRIGGPVVKEDFYDRKDILETLEKELKKGSIGFALYGLRRIGKSSILKEFTIKTKMVPIYIDITNIHPFSLENFYDAIFNSTIHAFKDKKKLPLKINIKEILNSSFTTLLSILKRVEINVNIKEYLEMKLAFKEGKANLQDLLNKSFSVIENLSKETKIRSVLIMDEFQLIENLDKNLFWAIRSIIQNWKYAGIIVAGSEISMLKQITSMKTSPFYMLLKIKEIGPFNKEESIIMLKDKFTKLNLKFNEKDLEIIHNLTGGYPFYLQWLGDKIYDTQEKEITLDLIKQAYEVLMLEGETIFAIDLEKISENEKCILIELSKGTLNMSGLSKKVNKPMSSVSKFIERLVEKSYLKKIKAGLYDFTDPLLKEYLKRKDS
jgi:AAA+ ATPase superfamily predicted ATPase